MNVAIGHIVQDGPFGGGNRFVVSLADALTEAGHRVRYDLGADDIDLILITDPRLRSPNVPFAAGAALRYLARRNPQAVVVHRINECDERKGTRGMNLRLRTANYAADHTVFIASWLRDLDVWRKESGQSVILNGADTSIFHARGQTPWDGTGPIRFVTHHWGGNRLKGFDVYERLDAMMGQTEWRDRIEFTYVGNLPADARLTHARHVPPLNGEALADELRRHHAYITASVNEPAGMHHIEGALCGLPLLYRESGALPEYCDGFGVSFRPETFEAALGSYLDAYADLVGRMPSYGNTAARMTAGYIDLFEDLHERRDAIAARRNLWRNPLIFAANQLPV
ncbi:MAG: hypothetical protein JJ899_05270 [Alphaproteobacteria bacterium]|nr:hypothetical protein [Alphaproteobacteria bacterium]